MFKKVILYFLVIMFLFSISPSTSEAAKYKQGTFEIVFPNTCEQIWNFTNGISTRYNNYEYFITVWLPTPLSEEELKICNGKTELNQLSEIEMHLLAKNLMNEHRNEKTTILNTSVINISPYRMPVVYYTYGGTLKYMEVQIISKGYSYLITCGTSLDSFDKYEAIFKSTISSFKIR